MVEEPEMSADERALERREHQLRAMENGHTIKIMPGSKEEMRAQLDSLLSLSSAFPMRGLSSLINSEMMMPPRAFSLSTP